MSDLLLVNTGNTPSSPYATWAAGANTVAAAAAIGAAGDRYLFDSTYNVSETSMTLDLPGSASNPNQMLSVTPSGGAGISALTAGAKITSTGTFRINGCVHAEGLTFYLNSASAYTLSFGYSGDSVQTYKNIRAELNSSASGILFGYPASSQSTDIAVDGMVIKFGSTSQALDAAGRADLRGLSIDATGSIPTALFRVGSQGGQYKGAEVLVADGDFVNANATTYLINYLSNGVTIKFRDIKMPAGWTPAYFSAIGTGKAGQRVEGYNFSAGSNTYRTMIWSYHMDLNDDGTIYCAGGADDGTPYSWKMATKATCAYPSSVAKSPVMHINNTATGGSKTVTVQIVHDSVTALKDSEVWLEVEELGDASSAKGTTVTDKTASVITTPADQTASGSSWTTTGMSNPNKQALAVTFTPQRNGYFICRVCCAKASKTLYIDPLPVVS